MRTEILSIVVLLVPAVARAGDDQSARRPSRLHGAFSAGRDSSGSIAGAHFGAAALYAPIRPLALGVEFALTHYPGGSATNKFGTTVTGIPPRTALWALVFAKANAFPSARVSPYAVVGLGRGSFREEGETDTGNALALGAGLDVRLGSRVTAFVEGRLAVMDVLVAGEDAHIEAPIRAGLRLRL